MKSNMWENEFSKVKMTQNPQNYEVEVESWRLDLKNFKVMSFWHLSLEYLSKYFVDMNEKLMKLER